MSTIYWLGQALIGLFFIVTGIYNIVHKEKQTEKIAQTILPYPSAALGAAIGLQLIGGTLLVIDFLPDLGAYFLLLFTVLATVFFMRFWQESDKQLYQFKFLMFVEHCAVIGALLMIISKS